MADAKINLETITNNEELKKLNQALAEGVRNVSSMTAELKKMEKATDNGTKATAEQVKRMTDLTKAINEQKQTNSAYNREITGTIKGIQRSAKAMVDGDKGARALAGAFKMTTGFTTSLSVALGGLAATAATSAASALMELGSQVVNMGLQAQQTIAHMNAMTNNLGSATEAYRAFNDVGRDTNFAMESIQKMGVQLMNMGYSASNAAYMIKLCSDAAAGLNIGEQGAQQLVDTIARIQSTGEASSRQLIALQMAGIDLNKVFEPLGMSAQEAMQAMDDGALSAQDSVQALIDYLKEFDGKMAESKDNTIDAWGDVEGNVAAACEEIGISILDAFNQSEIVQELIDFTQSLVDMIRGDGCGAFSDLGAIASEVLDFTGALLGSVLDILKLVIIAVNDTYGAFKAFGAVVVDAVRPAVDIVLQLYDAVKAVLSSIGHNFGAEVANSWSKTFGGDLDPEQRAEKLWASHANPIYDGGGNNFRSVARISRSGGGRSGGGGGSRGGSSGSSGISQARALAEEKRAADQKAREMAKAYKEGFDSTFEALQYESKSILDMLTGDPNSAKEKIAAIKEQLLADFATIDKGMSMTLMAEGEEGALNPLAAVLGKTPDQLTAELAAKQQSLEGFVESYKSTMAATAKEQIAAIQASENWKNQVTNAAQGIGDTMATSMTNILTGTESFGESLTNLVNDIIHDIVSSIMKMFANRLVTMFLGMLIPGGGGIISATSWMPSGGSWFGGSSLFASGGYISGPGTGTSDSIPAMLSNGEYVLRSRAVDRIGIGRLNAMNHFANGGYVGGAAGMGGPPVVINLNNESGTPLDAQQTESKFDGESWVIGVVLNGIATNRNGMRTVIKGAMG